MPEATIYLATHYVCMDAPTRRSQRRAGTCHNAPALERHDRSISTESGEAFRQMKRRTGIGGYIAAIAVGIEPAEDERKE